MSQSPRIVVLDGITTVVPGEAGGPTWAPLEAIGPVTVHDRTPPAAVPARVRGAEVVVLNKTFLDAGALAGEAFDACGLIALLSTGTNAVDLDAARGRGITVCNAPAYSTDSVAQHVFALVLGFANRVREHADAVEAGRWSGGADFTFSVAPLTELAGRTLGVVGFGDIGRRVAEIGHAFGMDLLVHSRTRRDAAVPVRWVGRDALFAGADVVSLHCPLTPETAGMVDAAQLGRMKPGALLVNTGRGGLVDETDLAAALRAGGIGGAALDVLTEEPPPADHPLIGCPRCVVTPHIAWATGAARSRLVGLVAGNVQAYLDGEPRNVVS
ncbi:D-2-hydroxyacid dehydrogenase [Phycisphaera mikurensis]|uniref:Putative glycerate dehydrogenase n=1 Tax=Phycisphaera mikurensis (strain NBRC 102666 / KCTC 22515 / FYK2301M01) TaxID=1142394 RepID=I0IHS1_PHYMF|nr:D-2-hydroxyacid dehydrogenase [Phycisphaera mikurensis]MBB6441053.1 glycerate dehydrogenase [Phycisphaera mikurensis]BAM04809.1 putative glycerate dehydrogenase [Phycisphaera mikurensis NBRC 102666]